MPSSLSLLPIEIIETIASELDRTNLCSVRLTCRNLHQKTLHFFGQTCWSTLQTDLSPTSLQKLQSISHLDQFKHHVQTLIVKKWTDELGRGFDWPRVKESGHVNTLSAPGAKLLQHVLFNLVNCRSFQIHSCGGVEEEYEFEYILPSDAIDLLLTIVAETKIAVKSFRVDFESQGSVDAKRLQMDSYQQPAFIAVWKDLEELSLEHHLTSDNLAWAQNLVLYTTSLRKLSLHFYFDHSTSFVRSLLSSPIVLQGLQELKLGRIHITENMLSSLLLHCSSSLHVLSFWHVYISSGTWRQILTQLQDFPFLDDITLHWPKEYSQNEEQEIVHLQFPALDRNHVVPDSEGQKIELRRKRWNGQPRVWGARFHGRVGMKKALGILIESIEHT
ncbi:hypothetical protein MMC12_004768 [Toensbergia leucococca]|nr:hypothetical protein [Toensbergia leucococca]